MMKRNFRIVYAALMLLTMLCMFLPIASFEDNSAGAIAADIKKQEERVESAKAKLERDTNSGKDQEALDKQKAKIDKEQAELDELIAQQQAVLSGGSQAGLSYAMLPGQLPSELEIDMEVVNAYKTYNANFEAYYTCVWLAFGLLAASLVLFLLGRDKLVSKCFTFSSITNLLSVILVFYVVMRLRAFPIKLPYSSAGINWFIALPMIVMPAVALGVNITGATNTKRTMIYLLCSCLSLISLLPFWIMLVNATRNSAQIQASVSLLPDTYLNYNWNVLATKNFDVLVGFKNSAIIAFGSTFLSVYFSAMTAYGLTVYKFKGSKALYSIILAIIMIPGQVTVTGFYMFMYRLGWTNSYLPLIIPSIASASTVFFFKQYLEANFQISLVEAARIDGAGEFYSYNQIILPIMVPAMATMGIMAVITSWNNYLTPLMLLSSPEMKTLPMMVKELRGDIYRTEYGSIYLGLSMTALPLLIVYFCFSKYIIAGVAVGGVKE